MHFQSANLVHFNSRLFRLRHPNSKQWTSACSPHHHSLSAFPTTTLPFWSSQSIATTWHTKSNWNLSHIESHINQYTQSSTWLHPHSCSHLKALSKSAHTLHRESTSHTSTHKVPVIFHTTTWGCHNNSKASHMLILSTHKRKPSLICTWQHFKHYLHSQIPAQSPCPSLLWAIQKKQHQRSDILWWTLMQEEDER